MLRPLQIGITSGDHDGVGPEVISKALRKIGPQKDVQFVLWRNSHFPEKDLRRIKKSFKLVTVNSWVEALGSKRNSPKQILDICGKNNPALWVEEAAQGCFFQHLDGMATGPLSKPTIKASGLKDIGHTDILKRISKCQNAYMTFLGDKFNVMLASGHIPLKNIPQHLSEEKIKLAIKAAQDFSIFMGGFKKKRKKPDLPLGVLGLNPHAGDQGLLGDHEKDIISPALSAIDSNRYPVAGPLVPDSAFTPDSLKRYGLFLAMYHDQGLIPFKAFHGFKAVHLTWGLPFIRTSVDHGPAFDIAGKNKADGTSMKLALQWAIKLCRERHK